MAPGSMTIGQALDALGQGKKLARGGWSDADPSYLVLIPSRVITTSYEPMATHLGQGRQAAVADHVDAIFDRPAQEMPVIAVGYQFSQADILVGDWYVVD